MKRARAKIDNTVKKIMSFRIITGAAAWVRNKLSNSNRKKKKKMQDVSDGSGVSMETIPNDSYKMENVRSQSRVDIKEFRLMSVLGVGSFGKVVKAEHKENKTIYAIKAVKRSRIVTSKKFNVVLNEKQILQKIKHPFIVRLNYTAKDARNLYFVLEYVDGGEMFYHLKAVGSFNDAQVGFFASQVALALDYLHSLNIIHRDIKPENIILDQEGYIKVTDFGFAKVVPTRTYTWCGTPEYIAPEIINMKGYGKSVDWWTLGVLMFEMATGDPPFEEANHIELYKKIVTREFDYPHNMSSELKDVIENLMSSDLTRRYGNTKNGVNDVKQHKFFKHIVWDDVLHRKVTSPYKPPPTVHALTVKDLVKGGKYTLKDFRASSTTLVSLPAELEFDIEAF